MKDDVKGEKSDTDSQSETAEDATPIPLHERERHETLWYDDGSVVIASKTTVYKVYKGTLAHQSSVFKDMFELGVSKTDTGSDETLDNVPVVEVQDEPAELTHFLLALHDSFYYVPTEATDYEVLSALLRLSTKYHVTRLRNLTIRHLGLAYSSTLTDYQDFIASEGCDRLVKQEDDTDMVKLAREVNVPEFLPVAFLSVAVNWDSYMNSIPTGDIITAVNGALKCRNALRTNVGSFLFDSASSENCSKKSQCLAAKQAFVISNAWLDLVDDEALLTDDLLIADKIEVPNLCSKCQRRMNESVAEGQATFWEKLPSFFELDDWQKLRMAKSEGALDDKTKEAKENI